MGFIDSWGLWGILWGIRGANRHLYLLNTILGAICQAILSPCPVARYNRPARDAIQWGRRRGQAIPSRATTTACPPQWGDPFARLNDGGDPFANTCPATGDGFAGDTIAGATRRGAGDTVAGDHHRLPLPHRFGRRGAGDTIARSGARIIGG